jgi:hypothetical protein
VHEQRGAAAQRAAQIQGEGAEPEQVGGDALHLGEQRAQPAGPAGHLDAEELLEGGVERLLAGHGRDVIVFVDDRGLLHEGELLAQLLHAAVEVAGEGDGLHDHLAVQVEVDPKHAVGRGMLRAEVQQHQLGLGLEGLDVEVHVRSLYFSQGDFHRYLQGAVWVSDA